MCDGDHQAGAELAIGLPPPVTPEEERRRSELVEAINAFVPTQAQAADYEREEEDRQKRIEETSAFTAAAHAQTLLDAWLDAHEDLSPSAGGRLFDALEIVRWDRHLIFAKLHRALVGHDEYAGGDQAWEDPLQNDWNGTAKLTLICIRRSVEAWKLLAEELGDPEAAVVSGALRDLQREVERAFPDADRFVRPGFDGV